MSSNSKNSETEKFIRETAMNATDILLNLKDEKKDEPSQKATVEDVDESEKNENDIVEEDENTLHAKEKKQQKQSIAKNEKQNEKTLPENNTSTKSNTTSTPSSSTKTKNPTKAQIKKQNKKTEKVSPKMTKSDETYNALHEKNNEEKKQKKLTPMQAIAMASERSLSFLDEKAKKFYSERQREQPTSLERENYEKDNDIQRQTDEQYKKRNAIIKKIFLAHLIAFVKNERFFTYSKMFYKRQGKQHNRSVYPLRNILFLMFLFIYYLYVVMQRRNVATMA